MSLKSDVIIDAAKFRPEAVSKSQEKFHEVLISKMQSGPKWFEVGAPEYRRMRLEGETWLPKPTLLESAQIFEIPSRHSGRNIPSRIIMPEQGGQCAGVYMHIHGGGWVLMSETTQDPLLKSIADDSNLAVISIGYRLAPEHPFPAGPEDCYDAAEWLVDNSKSKFGAPLRCMGGESAGGHLSVLTTYHLLKTRPQFHFDGLCLNYGAYDLSLLPAVRNYKKALGLTAEGMAKYMEAFLPGLSADECRNPSVSPLYKDLAGLKLPPALFICGTDDCLVDDTSLMALRWQMSGNEAIVKFFVGEPHGFTLFPPAQVPGSQAARDTTKEFLVRVLKH